MEKFEPLLKKLAFTRSLNSSYSYDDLIQELRLKILEMKQVNCCMDYSYVKTCLQNQINSLIRHDSKYLDSDGFAKVSEDEMLSIQNEYDNTGKKLEFFILVRLITEWSEKQDELTNVIINSFFYPSEDLEEYWKDTQLKSKRLENKEMIPLFTIAKYLKIDKNKITEIEKKLSKYLCRHGYSL